MKAVSAFFNWRAFGTLQVRVLFRARFGDRNRANVLKLRPNFYLIRNTEIMVALAVNQLLQAGARSMPSAVDCPRRTATPIMGNNWNSPLPRYASLISRAAPSPWALRHHASRSCALGAASRMPIGFYYLRSRRCPVFA